MPTQITNQAFLTFNYGEENGTASSNIATTTLQEPVTLTKTALGARYRNNDYVTYILNISNSGNTELTGLTVTENLGRYTTEDELSVVPLTYVGPAVLFIDGEISEELTVEQMGQQVEFVISELAAGSNAVIVYRVQVNSFAPLEQDSEIVNTAVLTANGLEDELSDSAVITVSDFANVEIVKTMSPNPVTQGTTLTYTFMLYNYGNTPATNVVLSDTFDPIPQDITVTVDGETVTPPYYSYENGVLTLPAAGSQETLTIPAATISQNGETGEIITDPGTVTVVVSGII